MTFDHLPGQIKHFNISSAARYSFKRVKEELAKCQLVCQTCHLQRELLRIQDDEYIYNKLSCYAVSQVFRMLAIMSGSTSSYYEFRFWENQATRRKKANRKRQERRKKAREADRAKRRAA